MKLLILGGTRFLGRHLAEQALARGHALTLVHRGQSGPELFAQATHVHADRNTPALAAALQDRGPWDACIDTCAYFPRQVRLAAGALAGRVRHYQLVSSISVYAAFDADGAHEDSALAALADNTTEAVTGDTYGGLKALCEAEAAASAAAFGHHVLIARPGLIVGPHDPTGRFTYWPQRVQRGGEVLAPGDGTSPVQFIDVRDLAAWMLGQAEVHNTGIFNLTGPTAPATIGELLQAARATLDPGARLTWVSETFLEQHQVAGWSDLPVWLPAAQAGLHRTRIERALATGLRCRPWAQTLADTTAWAQATAQAAKPGVGLTPEREAELLAAWHALSAA